VESCFGGELAGPQPLDQSRLCSARRLAAMDEKVQRLLKGRFLTEAYFLDPGVFVSINLTIVSRSTLSRQSQTKSALERLAACGRWQRQGRRPWRWSLITKEFSHPQDVPIDSAQGRLQPSAVKIYYYEGRVARDSLLDQHPHFLRFTARLIVWHTGQSNRGGGLAPLRRAGFNVLFQCHTKKS